ncbi:MAG TPA: alpha/beta fold hydrolase [Steroidobacteraceae bacterium]|nr:alpha/beta fold hydrolase [Steroidobacteraceae bacterium]
MAEENGKLENVEREFRAILAKATGGLAPHDYGTAFWDWWLNLAKSPGTQLELQQNALAKAMELWKFNLEAMQGKPLAPAETGDRRFANPAWQQYPFNVWAQAFRSGMELLEKSAHGVPGVEPQNVERVEFAAKHAAEALSPTNNPLTNPEVLKQTVEERGQNLARGYKHFLEDLERLQNGGQAPGADEFRVGEKVAVTEGQVILRNELMELIQYSPTTPDVHPEPVLIVPAWIMKYYILDLSPKNSLVAWLVDQGFTVFMISWKNPTAADRNLGMDDYVRKGVYAALDAVATIVPDRGIHAVGYCIGGTLLTIAASALSAWGDTRIQDITLFAAQTDFSEPGELSLFISPAQIEMLEAIMYKEGVLDSKQMGAAFAMLRAHDLLWQPAVKSYLKGERDQQIDLMAWNADGTRMPWKMHTEYLLGLYLHNDLAEGRFKVEGVEVNLADIAAPMFVVGTETDHVAPWKSVYKADRLAGSSEFTFLLTSGGHNAGIVSGPAHPKRRHRVRTRRQGEPNLNADEWFESTAPLPGSWWPTWGEWLKTHSTQARVPPPAMGAPESGYAPIADAPGEYVRQR